MTDMNLMSDDKVKDEPIIEDTDDVDDDTDEDDDELDDEDDDDSVEEV